MRGSIKQRAKGSWEIKFDLPRDETKKRRQRTRTFHGTKRDAERELARILAAIDDGTFVDEQEKKGQESKEAQEEGPLRLKDHMLRWLEVVRQSVGDGAYQRYRTTVHCHVIPELGDILLAELTPQQIADWMLWSLEHGRKRGAGWSDLGTGLSRQSVHHDARTLRQALDMAVQWDLIRKNPARAISLPRPGRMPMVALTTDEVQVLLKAVEGLWIEPIVVLAVMTGMRRGELLALKWEVIDLESKRLSVCRTLEKKIDGTFAIKEEPKTSCSRRSIPLNDTTIQALVRHRRVQEAKQLRLGSIYQDQGLVFCRNNGQPLNADAVTQAFLRLWKGDNPVPITRCRLHDLRHTFASIMLAKKVHIKVVSSLLGHASVNITLDRYSHLLPGMGAEAIDLLDEEFRQRD